MKYLFIVITSFFLIINTVLAQESFVPTPKTQPVKQQNIIKKSFNKILKTQRKLNSQITRTLKKVKTDKNPQTLLWGILLAFAYGIIHALGPGHSKGIVASYFLSAEEKLRKVPIMAMQISMTHVITPILLVFITDISLKQVITNPDNQVYWFKVISYALICIIGVYMLVKKIISLKNNTERHRHNSTTLAISAGLVPCVGSLLILLFTKASDMFLTGILLVLAIGLGIGFTICLVGFASFFFKKLTDLAGKDDKKPVFIHVIEFTGPIFIIALGLIMFIEII